MLRQMIVTGGNVIPVERDHKRDAKSLGEGRRVARIRAKVGVNQGRPQFRELLQQTAVWAQELEARPLRFSQESIAADDVHAAVGETQAGAAAQSEAEGGK